MHLGRAQIWFDGPDEAYLVAAAIRRHLGGTVVADVLLVPTVHGPALELPEDAAEDPLVRALVRRFGGHVDRIESPAIVGAGETLPEAPQISAAGAGRRR
jgi:hypothetical protein